MYVDVRAWGLRVDARSGVTTHVPADVRVKRTVVGSSARTVVVAADQTKPGAVTFGRVCPLSAVERMATDAPPASAADLQALGLAVDRV